MRIKYLAIGHGVIYYEVYYATDFWEHKLVQYAANYHSCFGAIWISKYVYDSRNTIKQKIHYKIEQWGQKND